jgi:precorrin-2/cobalt-factor-2 C20-methyltransferase
MTLKAQRLIREHTVIAVPGEEAKSSFAYRIAVAAVPELESKQLVPVPMPMIRDKEALQEYHRQGARLLETYLQQGEDVVFLTLGDPTVYSGFCYIQHIVEEDGFATEMVSGVTSFCAAAAKAKMPLVLGEETLHILPTSRGQELLASVPGTFVYMKAGSRLSDLKAQIKEQQKDAVMVENCGTAQEKIYESVEDIPDKAGYYSLVIVKE